MHPLNGRSFTVEEKHKAPQHYSPKVNGILNNIQGLVFTEMYGGHIKIVTTMYDFGFGQEKIENMIPSPPLEMIVSTGIRSQRRSYQMTTQNRVAKYETPYCI